MNEHLDLISKLNSIHDSDIRQATFIPNYHNIIAHMQLRQK